MRMPMIFFLSVVLLASPALAQDSASIPEPTDYLLFAAGIVGLIVGRSAAQRRRRKDDGDEDA